MEGFGEEAFIGWLATRSAVFAESVRDTFCQGAVQASNKLTTTDNCYSLAILVLF